MLTLSQSLVEMLYRCSFYNKLKKCYHPVDFTNEEIDTREVKKPGQRHTASRWKGQVQTQGVWLQTTGLWKESEVLDSHISC